MRRSSDVLKLRMRLFAATCACLAGCCCGNGSRSIDRLFTSWSDIPSYGGNMKPTYCTER